MAKTVIDGLFQDPVSLSGSSKPSKHDPAPKAISALGGTFIDGTMHGDVSGSPSCGAFPNVFPPAVPLDISCPLDLSYAGDSCDEILSDAKALAATVQAEGTPDSHRPKHIASPATYLGMVTKTVPPSSPEFHSAAGRAAINKEVGGLRQQTVWDESIVAEWSSVRHQRHNGFPMFSPLGYYL